MEQLESNIDKSIGRIEKERAKRDMGFKQNNKSDKKGLRLARQRESSRI